VISVDARIVLELVVGCVCGVAPQVVEPHACEHEEREGSWQLHTHQWFLAHVKADVYAIADHAEEHPVHLRASRNDDG